MIWYLGLFNWLPSFFLASLSIVMLCWKLLITVMQVLSHQGVQSFISQQLFYNTSCGWVEASSQISFDCFVSHGIVINIGFEWLGAGKICYKVITNTKDRPMYWLIWFLGTQKVSSGSWEIYWKIIFFVEMCIAEWPPCMCVININVSHLYQSLCICGL